MKRIILSIIFLVSYTASFSQNWQLIWEDDFNGNSLDQSKWAHDIGTGSQYGMWGWGNGELQYYQPQNTILNNGIAKIEVKEEPNGIVDSWGASSYFSSSKITTKGIFDFRYGKVEARIKTIDGQGFWPAFWMLPTGGSWPCDGEIDIMEQWGNNYLTNSTTGAAHIGTCPYSQSTHFYESFSSYISSGSYADDFHTYSVIWKEDTITWYVDETELFSLNPSSYWSIPSQSAWPFNANEWYLMINLAITQAGPNSNTVFPNQMEIDYVRVYQENTTSIESVRENENIIYPNPSNNYIVFKGNNLKYIRIYNIEGSLILDKILNQNKTINVEHLDSGMYLVELEDSFGVKTNKKVIIN
ncbi:family 16 glycosylhydrolase [bacterium]|jgi:beta-glucanase (GH16 family)|nr:family 16 glycosylhydrolase [Flavobacteriales bacterium]MBT6650222.1 family 16 glycosylhydrolase [Flavobacteriales bacterium]MBT6815963.1 family 16 glycosylhydrolase [Flavobacteriales bacterium]MDB3870481.1 family 16 glycosylhydrolase [bacterium]